MPYTSTGRSSRPLASQARLPGGVGTGVPPKVPPTPREERRAHEDRTKIENAWKAFDGLCAEFDRYLAVAYEQGRRDERMGSPPRAPTRDSIRRQQGRGTR